MERGYILPRIKNAKTMVKPNIINIKHRKCGVISQLRILLVADHINYRNRMCVLFAWTKAGPCSHPAHSSPANIETCLIIVNALIVFFYVQGLEIISFTQD